ncbi:MAG: hypothetical protein ABR863_03410 [Roseiarcus sp.]|jgi:hypothetical protein
MSWDLYLIQFQNGMPAHFDAKPSLAVVEKYCVNPVKPPFTPFICELADGLEVEFWAQGLDGKELFDGAMISLRGYTEGAARLIYDFAKSGDMTILNSGNPTVLLLDPKWIEQLPVDLGEGQRDRTVHVDSAGSLDAALSGGFEAWRKYRDHVVNGQ